MGPVVFESVPWVFSFAAVAALAQICIILIGTGKRYLKEVSVATVALAGAAVGGNLAVASSIPSLIGIVAGLMGGAALGRLLRPVGVGLALAFLAYSVSYNLIGLQDVQYVAALVLFAYGLLLTDVAPTFVSGLLASAILVLLAEWAGVPSSLIFASLTALAAVRIGAAVFPARLAPRGQQAGGFVIRKSQNL